MLAIVIITKSSSFTTGSVEQFIANQLPTIQERDGKPRLLSSIRVAGKVNDDYVANLVAATVEGDTAHDTPTEVLFVAIGEEFGIGELDPAVNCFVQDLECFGWVKYHAHHGDLNCVTFRTQCGKAVAELIASDAKLTSLRLSK